MENCKVPIEEKHYTYQRVSDGTTKQDNPKSEVRHVECKRAVLAMTRTKVLEDLLQKFW